MQSGDGVTLLRYEMLRSTSNTDDPESSRRTSSLVQAASNISDEKQLMHKAPMWSCYINITSTIIGAGILGLPYAYSRTGYFLGSWFVVLCGLMSFTGLHLLSACAKFTQQSLNQPSSFYSVAEVALSKKSYFTLLIDFTIFIKCFGVSIAYLIVIGDLMPAVVKQAYGNDNNNSFWVSRTPWIIIGFIIAAPLSCFQSLDALKYTSSLSVIFILFLVVLVVLYQQSAFGLDPCADISASEICHGKLLILF